MDSNDIGFPAVIDARDYGAAGDGVSDDSAAVQRAIGELAGRGGGTLRFANGNYLLNVNLPRGVRLVSG